MRSVLGLRHAVVGWVFLVFFGALLYLFDGRTYANLYKMFIVNDTVGIFILVLAGLPIGYLISQVSWCVFSLWPVNFKFPWAVVGEFSKAKNDGIAEDSQSDHVYFKDADERMVSFNRSMTEFYCLHMDVIAAITIAFISIYLRINQMGINIAKVLKAASASRLIPVFVVATALLVLALLVNARSCRRDLIDQKRLWNRDKLEDKAKYVHLNPVLILIPAALMLVIMMASSAVWLEISLLVILYFAISLISLYKISL